MTRSRAHSLPGAMLIGGVPRPSEVVPPPFLHRPQIKTHHPPLPQSPFTTRSPQETPIIYRFGKMLRAGCVEAGVGS